MRRSIMATLARSDTELVELFIALFSIRFIITLMIPAFNSFSDSRAYAFFLSTLGHPYVLALIIAIPTAAWVYGFVYKHMIWRIRGLQWTMFLYTVLTIGFLFSNWHRAAWTVYGLVATSSALVYARVRRNA